MILITGGVYPFQNDNTGRFESLPVEELNVTPLDVVLTDLPLDPGADQALLARFPTWPAAETGSDTYIPGIVLSSPSLPWSAEQLFELLYPDAG